MKGLNRVAIIFGTVLFEMAAEGLSHIHNQASCQRTDVFEL